MTTPKKDHKWGMVVDLDKCTGCQACVIACQSENNLPLNDEEMYIERRAHEWIRIERYWEVPSKYADHPEDAPFDEMKARFIPLLCHHCDNAPCEPVCPVYATYHNDQGLNVQVYNRCVGTRYCANNCPYSVRFFNYWKPQWPESLPQPVEPGTSRCVSVASWRNAPSACSGYAGRSGRLKTGAVKTSATRIWPRTTFHRPAWLPALPIPWYSET